MKKSHLFLAAGILAAAVIGFSSFTQGTAKKTTGNSSVNGGGTAIEGGKKSTFVFNAVNNGGTTTGHLVYQLRVSDVRIQMDLDCLSINGNRATLSGTVTSLTGDNIPSYIFVGQRGSFSVEDNGNGGNDDKISDLILDPGASCANNWNTYLNVQGNIGIHNN